jgi:hypothetical protein
MHLVKMLLLGEIALGEIGLGEMGNVKRAIDFKFH